MLLRRDRERPSQEIRATTVRLSCVDAWESRDGRITVASIVRENVCHKAKNVKSHVFGFEKKR